MTKPNEVIRDAARKAGVYLWEVANAYGLSDGNFSRKLRKELPQEETERILGVIDQLAQTKREAI